MIVPTDNGAIAQQTADSHDAEKNIFSGESRGGDETGKRAGMRCLSEFVGCYRGIGRRHYGGERRCGDAKNFCEIGRQPAGERERQVIYQLRDHYSAGAR